MNSVRSACSVMDCFGNGGCYHRRINQPVPFLSPRARELVTLVQEVTRERFVTINKRSPMR